jgi:hypothetical protein
MSAKPSKSAKKLTPQQESFARWVVRGYSYAAAYRRAYVVGPKTLDVTVWANASRLAANTLVKARIEELTAQAAKRAGVTKESMLAEMAFNREIALDAGNINAAISSSRDRARVGLLITDKLELTGKDGAALAVSSEVTLEDRSMNEIARRIAFALTKGKRASRVKGAPTSESSK